MNCCGHIVEITTMDDPAPRYLCQRCGLQGPGCIFPDPPEEPVEIDEYFGLWARVTRGWSRLVRRIRQTISQ